jgi:hypothetical protein
MPTTNLASQSLYKNIRVTILDSDESTFSAGQFRANNLAQELIYAYDCEWENDGLGRAREVGFNKGVLNSITSAPTVGFWRQGTILTKKNSSGTGSQVFAFYNEADGTPGTWRSMSATFA